MLAQAFAMRLLACDPYASPEALAGLGVELVDRGACWPRSDFVCVCVPLNDETRHMIGAEELRLMKPSAYLVNTSRGSVVDEPALIEGAAAGDDPGRRPRRLRAGAGRPGQPAAAHGERRRLPALAVPHRRVLHHRLSGKLEQAREIMAGKIPAALVNREVLDREDFQAKLARIRR